MKILVASPYPKRLERAFHYGDDTVFAEDGRIHATGHLDWIICYGYRHIIKPEIIEASCPIINIHLSVLPWNRGASPNLWSWIDNTPKGISIHKIDSGIDTGPIYHIEYTSLDKRHTLSTSYDRLRFLAEDIFAMVWPNIRDGLTSPVAQQGHGTYHTIKQSDEVLKKLPLGWDTPVKDLTPELLK